MSDLIDKKNSEKNKKIIIAGLDNSGKSSIVLSIIGKMNLINYLSLNPTIGPNITDFESIDSKFNIWDLGGQKSYINEYIENFESYITGCSKILFVIDVQDVQRYDLALKYLENIMKKIQQMNLEIDTSIFLHKYDPDLKEIQPLITEEMIHDLIQKVKKLIPVSFFFEIYKTTIYTIFDKTLIY
ncbi:MAG: ADP-ribosylation factor-like protein [Candidatus Thorarchaeota archaeon]